MPLSGKNQAAAQEQNLTDIHQKENDCMPGNNERLLPLHSS